MQLFSRNVLCCVTLTLCVGSTAQAADPLSASAGLVEGEAVLTALEGTTAIGEGSAAVTGGSSLASDAAMFADEATLVTRIAPAAERAGWRTVAGGLARKVGTRFLGPALGPAGMMIGAAELGKFLGEEGREAYDFYAVEWASWRDEHRHEEIMAAIDRLEGEEGEPGQGWLTPADLGYSNFGHLKQLDYAQTAAPLPAPPPAPPRPPTGPNGERKDPAITPAANPPARAYAPGSSQKGGILTDPPEDQRAPAEAPAGTVYDGPVGDPKEEKPTAITAGTSDKKPASPAEQLADRRYVGQAEAAALARALGLKVIEGQDGTLLVSGHDPGSGQSVVVALKSDGVYDRELTALRDLFGHIEAAKPPAITELTAARGGAVVRLVATEAPQSDPAGTATPPSPAATALPTPATGTALLPTPTTTGTRSTFLYPGAPEASPPREQELPEPRSFIPVVVVTPVDPVPASTQAALDSVEDLLYAHGATTAPQWRVVGITDVPQDPVDGLAYLVRLGLQYPGELEALHTLLHTHVLRWPERLSEDGAVDRLYYLRQAVDAAVDAVFVTGYHPHLNAMLTTPFDETDRQRAGTVAQELVDAWATQGDRGGRTRDAVTAYLLALRARNPLGFNAIRDVVAEQAPTQVTYDRTLTVLEAIDQRFSEDQYSRPVRERTDPELAALLGVGGFLGAGEADADAGETDMGETPAPAAAPRSEPSPLEPQSRDMLPVPRGEALDRAHRAVIQVGPKGMTPRELGELFGVDVSTGGGLGDELTTASENIPSRAVMYGRGNYSRYYTPDQTPPEQLVRIVREAGTQGVAPAELQDGTIRNYVSPQGIRAVASDALTLRDEAGQPLVVTYGRGNALRYYPPGQTPPQQLVRIARKAGTRGVAPAELQGGVIPNYASYPGIQGLASEALALRDESGQPLVVTYGKGSALRYYPPGQTPPQQLVRIVREAGPRGVAPGELRGGVIPNNVSQQAIQAVASDALALRDESEQFLLETYGGLGHLRYYAPDQTPPLTVLRQLSTLGGNGSVTTLRERLANIIVYSGTAAVTGYINDLEDDGLVVSNGNTVALTDLGRQRLRELGLLTDGLPDPAAALR